MTAERKTRYLRDMLDRPIRVCGMVRNEGEPGGGPFWVSSPTEASRSKLSSRRRSPPDRKS